MVSTLERFVTNDGLRSTLRDSHMKHTKHSTVNKHGYNDVSRFTWSSIQPESSELPPAR